MARLFLLRFLYINGGIILSVCRAEISARKCEMSLSHVASRIVGVLVAQGKMRARNRKARETTMSL